MDPLTAIGLASNIIAFVDFASELVSSAHEIYKSGALQENVDISSLVTVLSLHVNKLKQATSKSVPTQTERQLQSLASKCADFAEDISKDLKKLQVNPNGTSKTLNSVGAALRTAWKQKGIKEKVDKLNSFRDALQFDILVSFK